MALQDFKRVLREAVNFFSKKGYRSSHDLDTWSKRLEQAARSSFISPAVAGQLIARHLTGLYSRFQRRLPNHLKRLQVETAQRLGPEQFFRQVETLPVLQMHMRNELDRRIAASTDLIKIRREEAIDATLRRFKGWASSVPPGGTPAPKQPEKELLAKEFKQIRYETNRLNIDQGHKLNASIAAVYAEGTGAIAARWRSNWREENYDYREEHKKRDNKIYAIRDNWAIEKGLMKAGPAGYTDEITQPSEEPMCRCLPGSTRIPYGNIEIVFRRPYDGVLVEITTVSGKSLRLTPNHPVLSQHGWRNADALNVGDHVVESIDQIVDPLAEKNEYHTIPSIGEIFEFLAPCGSSRVAPGASDQFHGDGIADRNVDIVFANRPLRIDGKAGLVQRSRQFGFSNALATCSAPGALHQHLDRFRAASKTLADFVTSQLPSLGGLLVEAYALRFATCPQRHTGISDPLPNGRRRGVVACRDDIWGKTRPIRLDDLLRWKIKFLTIVDRCFGFRPDRDPGLPKPSPNGRIGDLKSLCQDHGINSAKVCLSQITRIKRSPFLGHVYNLQTTDGWFVANGMITHNCYYVYIYNLITLPPNMLTAKGKRALNVMEDLDAATSQ
jgi:hypothetical protein